MKSPSAFAAAIIAPHSKTHAVDRLLALAAL
jgi:hypothetical protein